MRWVHYLVLALAGCGVEVKSGRMNQTADPDIDAGMIVGGGGSTIVADARTAPPDGIPQGLAPCDEAVYHSDFTWVQRTVFDVSCSTDGCHSTVDNKAGLDLSRGNAHANLVDVASSEFSGWQRVVAGSSSESMLMVQIGGEPGPPLERYMPLGDPRLCTEQVDAIRRWIASGAAND